MDEVKADKVPDPLGPRIRIHCRSHRVEDLDPTPLPAHLPALDLPRLPHMLLHIHGPLRRFLHHILVRHTLELRANQVFMALLEQERPRALHPRGLHLRDRRHQHRPRPSRILPADTEIDETQRLVREESRDMPHVSHRAIRDCLQHRSLTVPDLVGRSD